jgi:hypothetical protein
MRSLTFSFGPFTVLVHAHGGAGGESGCGTTWSRSLDAAQTVTSVGQYCSQSEHSLIQNRKKFWNEGLTLAVPL